MNLLFALLFSLNPLDFPTYEQEVTATFASEAEAAAATCAVAPLPDNAELAFSCRWDDTTSKHEAKGRMMVRAGVKGTFYFVGNTNAPFFSEGPKALVPMGHAIGNHTLTHPRMLTVGVNAAFEEIAANRIRLETMLQRTVTSYVSPYGWQRNPNDPDHGRVLAQALVASGHFVTEDSPMPWSDLPLRTWMGTNRFAADDRNPQRELFVKGFEKALAAAKANPDAPRVTLGTHSWCDEKGEADQESWLKEFFHRDGVVQMNDWEYGAYRYQYFHGGVEKTGVRGATATFRVRRYAAAFVGDAIALSLAFSSAPQQVTQGGRTLVRAPRGTWTLPQDPVAAKLPEISRSTDGMLEISPDEAKATVTVRFRNTTPDELADVYLAAALPPAWSVRRVTAVCPRLAPGSTFERTFGMGERSTADFAVGPTYYPVSADFVRAGRPCRVWADRKLPQAPLPASVKREKIAVFHYAVERIVKERGVSFEQAGEMLRAAGVTGFDAAYDYKGMDDLLRTGLKPVNFYGTVKFLEPDGDAATADAFIASAVRHGAKVIMIIPSHFTGKEDQETEFRKMLPGLRAMVAKARAAGLTPTMEDVGWARHNPCSYGKYVARFVDEAPGLRLALDSGNLSFAGRGDDILELQRHCADRLGHVHLKDFPQSGPSKFRASLGCGVVPNRTIVERAKASGYDGWYTLEHPVGTDTYEDVVRQAALVNRWGTDRPEGLLADEVSQRGRWEIKYDKPDMTPLVFGAESCGEGVEAAEYCLYVDLFYADGTPRWGLKASFRTGTHGWERAACAFVPEKPVARVVMNAFARNPGPNAASAKGKVWFRNVYLARREGRGDVIVEERYLNRPFAETVDVMRQVFTGRKVERTWTTEPARPDEGPRSTVPSGRSVVWTADSMRRVAPLDFPSANERRDIVLELARNERESAQILVSVAEDVAWLAGTLELGTLRNAAGAALKGDFTWERVGYVPLEPPFDPHPLFDLSRGRWIPDPLLPAAPFKVLKGSTQATWLTVRADADAEPGVYAGNVRVLRDGAEAAVVPVRVTVRPFALPKRFGLKTAFSVMDCHTRARYPDRFDEMRRQSHDVLLDHRLNPDDITRTSPPLIEDLLHAKERGMNSFNVLNIVPPPKKATDWVLLAKPEALFTDAFYESFTNRVVPYVAELRRHGLDDMAYLYGFDERQSEYYEGIDRMWRRLGRDVPGVPLMTTAKMYADMTMGKTNLPCLVTTDWYCPCTYRWDRALNARLRAVGKKIWWYTCCGPRAPYANMASYLHPLVEGRLLLGFMTHWSEADGFLFWLVNPWGVKSRKTMDERETYFPEWHTRSSEATKCPGDGAFLYPGERHVLPSVRLANIRDGEEDYEWILLAAESGKADVVRKEEGGLVRSLTDYTHSPEELRAARARIGDALESR